MSQHRDKGLYPQEIKDIIAEDARLRDCLVDMLINVIDVKQNRLRLSIWISINPVQLQDRGNVISLIDRYNVQMWHYRMKYIETYCTRIFYNCDIRFLYYIKIAD